MKAITGIAGCCARAVSGHAAAPPRRVMNSRRFKPKPPVLPTERIAHLGTADCCIHPPGRNEMIAITPPKIVSKEVAQNRPPHFSPEPPSAQKSRAALQQHHHPWHGFAALAAQRKCRRRDQFTAPAEN